MTGISQNCVICGQNGDVAELVWHETFPHGEPKLAHPGCVGALGYEVGAEQARREQR